ncbi:MAG TPA: LacI family DNA-binding transcriptional regulator [Kouleothrix sp.]|uniref:LacI family DNA-binding transcriptional regulator n=1 Tax=Kouleothrix sp. TaxID=2779161 RepID=UPI002B811BEE|nr:LacI family DNA-binding transcriptional regulator [Kouleothrix sp.]HRC75163.1 LacI family DNA-binding transcriptional regulator [Kouleothrix sp.]
MSDPTIYDVADLANVSISTVSRVLNSPDQVNESTRTRVLAAIDQLNFVPKAEATARARKGTRRIGVLAPFITYPSFVQRLRGVATLTDAAYEMVIYNVESASRRDGYLSTLPVTRRLDGLIVMALPFGSAAAQRLRMHNLETVLIECTNPWFSSVEIDDDAGGEMVARYLLERGHRRFGFVGDANVPDYAIHTSERRFLGYQRALRAAGCELQPEHVRTGQHGLEQARKLTHQLLEAPGPPTAIFAPSDTQAMGVLKAARERGLAVPSELAVIGFDDVEVADYIGLTTVRQPLEESGRVAVELLLARLADRARPVQRVTLQLEIVRRETA